MAASEYSEIEPTAENFRIFEDRPVDIPNGEPLAAKPLH
jgi:hypothetical protein